MAKDKKIRVLMAKPGLDGHYRGLLVVTQALRDAGMEVVYGSNMSPQEIAQAALQEDVDVVGISVMSASPTEMGSEVLKELKKAGLSDILIVIGGILYEDDLPALKKMGYKGLFRPGTPLDEIVDFIKKNAGKAKAEVKK